MGKKSPLVDAYIEKAAPFAKPILRRLRSIFHKASPKLEETLKWGVPFFEYKGLVGGFAAFKHNVTWGLWKAALLDDPRRLMERDASSSMSGGRLIDLADLPEERYLLDLIRQAVQLNEQGIKLPVRSAPARRPPIRMPKQLIAAFAKSPRAKAFFETLTPSCKREYLEWITEAKREETRDTRIATTIQWLGEGKKRNWKYAR